MDPTIPNTAPYFDPEPITEYEATAGNAYFEMDIDLPPIFDDENDNVDVDFNFGQWEGYFAASPSNDKIIA